MIIYYIFEENYIYLAFSNCIKNSFCRFIFKLIRFLIDLDIYLFKNMNYI